MDSPQKLAFVIQSNRLQGLIWQALLKSQKVAVILEPSRADLVDCISQIASAGLTLPDVILLDTEISDLNPYEFCRWCRQHFPQIQIFLTRFNQNAITDTERRWAIQQGAAGFLGGFHRDTLMSTAAESIRLILSSLDYPFLNEKSLLSVLLNVRRQMVTASPPTPALTSLESPLGNGQSKAAQAETRPAFKSLAGSYANGKPANGKGANGNGNGATTNLPSPGPVPGADSPDVLNDISWVTSGLRALNHRSDNGTSSSAAEGLFTNEPPTPPPLVKSSEIPKLPEADTEDKPTKVRRYRGVIY